ncbi:hypothetical protein Patl1_14740 [Pistacia atlantica]|uniref:Uncharacterized protein n=1 Tax=Pistacia atlantica TaxID=434234 RepID=A0ACC1AWT1_9ROSI|nr:hypothetical protein Patl1_14740 [Pistacia atlantica]
MVNQETLPADPLGYRCPVIRRDNPQRALIFYRDQLDQQTYDQVHSLTNIHNQCTATLSTFTSESAMQSLTNIRITCTRVLQMIGEIRHLETVPAPTITMAPPSPSQANDKEGLPLLIAQMPTKTKSLSVRGRGRAKGRGRALGTQQKAMEPVITLQHSSPQVVVASLTTPSQNNDIHIEEPSTLNLDGSATPAESMHPLEGETTTEKVPLYPHYDYEESPCLTQVESRHVTRHKKKPKVL